MLFRQKLTCGMVPGTIPPPIKLRPPAAVRPDIALVTDIRGLWRAGVTFHTVW